MSLKCADCKWGVIGRYNKIYKGCPIGCNKPIDEGVMAYGECKCFEPKEKSDAVNTGKD